MNCNMLTDEQKATARPLPIFKPELRQAIRDGRKTQTRRIVKNTDMLPEIPTSPYGKPGDIAYLREPLWKHGKVDYSVEQGPVFYADEPEWFLGNDGVLRYRYSPDGHLPARERSQQTLKADPDWSTGYRTSARPTRSLRVSHTKE